MGNENRFWRDPALGEATDIETSGGRMRAFTLGQRRADRLRPRRPGQREPLAQGRAAARARLPLRHARPAAGLARAGDAGRRPLPHRARGPDRRGDRRAGARAARRWSATTPAARCRRSRSRATPTSSADSSSPPATRTTSSRRGSSTSSSGPPRYPALARALFAPLRIRALRETPLAFGWLDALEARRARRRLLRAAGADQPRGRRRLRPVRADGRTAATRWRRSRSSARSTGPTLIAWSRDDKFFHAGERLAADIPRRAPRVDRGRPHVLDGGPARAGRRADRRVRARAGRGGSARRSDAAVSRRSA